MDPLPASEYARRIAKVQDELKRESLDVLVSYSSECESGASRYLTGFWPFFDFASVIVPAEGDAILVTGGPESLEFAQAFGTVSECAVNPLLVETSAPDWVPETSGESFKTILQRACGKVPQRMGIANWNTMPHIIWEDLRNAAPQAEFVDVDDVLIKVQAIKSEVEIPYIIEAYRITEEGLRAALEFAEPGRREWELEAEARALMTRLGAEGMSYPAWVCSGPNSVQSLCRSTNRAIAKNELIQLTINAKYMGYCGNMCRSFSFGDPPEPARQLQEVALEAVHYALGAIRPGVAACDVFKGYYDILAKYGFENFTLYGPAHGTGTTEVEGLWLAEQADFIIQPNMLFNIDIWLCNGSYGLRYEDGVLVTETGLKELTSFRREKIVLS
jgi:Xaa-Pro aminopeptidase